MAVADKIIALFEALRVEQVQNLRPEYRRRFAALCRHWADIAEPPPRSAPGTFPTGILGDLRSGNRQE